MQWRLDGLTAEDEAAWERTAQQTAWILQAMGSNITAKRLLGTDSGDLSFLLE